MASQYQRPPLGLKLEEKKNQKEGWGLFVLQEHNTGQSLTIQHHLSYPQTCLKHNQEDNEHICIHVYYTCYYSFKYRDIVLKKKKDHRSSTLQNPLKFEKSKPIMGILIPGTIRNGVLIKFQVAKPSRESKSPTNNGDMAKLNFLYL